jgi:hypothetical protein
LWDDFEAQKTPEARFANAVDRLQPLLQNEHAGGGWRVRRSPMSGSYEGWRRSRPRCRE